MTVLVPSALTIPSGSMRSIPLVCQVHVRLGEGAVIAVGECGPLAPEVVVRGELAAQLFVADRCEPVHLGQVGGGDVQPPQVTVMHAHVDDELVDAVGHPADRALGEWYAGEQPLRPLREAQVDLGHHPDRGALVHGEVGGLLGELGDELDRGRAGTDDGDPAVLDVVVVIPGRGVDDLARETGDARDVGRFRLGQEAGGGDQVAGAQRLAAGQRDPPYLRVLVPPRPLDGGVEPNVAAHAVLVGHVVGVLLDLRARREQSRPVRIRLEKIRVSGGGDVDGQPGVVVDEPGATQVVLALEDDEVVVAQPLELDRRAYTPETGPHDDRVELLRSHEQTVPQVPAISDRLSP